MNQKDAGLNITCFFCKRIDVNQDVNRRALERELGPRIRFFPLPCSGRIDPLHLLRALESGADKVYLLACPEGACRYREGNIRAKKRLVFAQGLIQEIGLAKERLELINVAPDSPKNIDTLVRELLMRESTVGPSPVMAPIKKAVMSNNIDLPLSH